MCNFYNKQPQLTSCSVNNVSVYLSCIYTYRDNDHSITVWMYLHCGPPSRLAQDGLALADNQQTCSINIRVVVKDTNFELQCYRNHLNMWKMHTIRGKILEGENFGEFGKIFLANIYKYSGITRLPADSPKFSSPITSSLMIGQKFPPPKFSHIQYCMYACLTVGKKAIESLGIQTEVILYCKN